MNFRAQFLVSLYTNRPDSTNTICKKLHTHIANQTGNIEFLCPSIFVRLNSECFDGKFLTLPESPLRFSPGFGIMTMYIIESHHGTKILWWDFFMPKSQNENTVVTPIKGAI